jgi:hypothetical protein
VRGARSYEICVVPHGDPALAVFEHYEGPTEARQRHAEMTKWLRDHGWTVIAHVAGDRIHAAA